MIDIKDKTKCTGCSACFNACPFGCIEMKADEEGFEYPFVDKSKCRECGICDKVCPRLNIKKASKPLKLIYVASNKNESQVLNSTSGGLFVLLAKSIISDGGIVFGAAFDKDYNLVHTMASSEEQLEALQKSKYIQSTISNSYKKVKGYLNKGTKVLFCGTPCQISGLKRCVGDNENLICIDLICHGVPSQKSFKRYLDYIRILENDETPIKNINFRSKSGDWGNFLMEINFQSGKTYLKSKDEDAFLRAFLNDIMLRPSCSECVDKGFDRESDITLADAWGIKNYNSDAYNEKGTSAAMVHTEKGKALLEKVLPQTTSCMVREDFIRRFNINAYYSVVFDRRRNKYYRLLNSGISFDKCVERSINIDYVTKLQRKIRIERVRRNERKEKK